MFAIVVIAAGAFSCRQDCEAQEGDVRVNDVEVSSTDVSANVELLLGTSYGPGPWDSKNIPDAQSCGDPTVNESDGATVQVRTDDVVVNEFFWPFDEERNRFQGQLEIGGLQPATTYTISFSSLLNGRLDVGLGGFEITTDGGSDDDCDLQCVNGELILEKYYGGCYCFCDEGWTGLECDQVKKIECLPLEEDDGPQHPNGDVRQGQTFVINGEGYLVSGSLGTNGSNNAAHRVAVNGTDLAWQAVQTPPVLMRAGVGFALDGFGYVGTGSQGYGPTRAMWQYNPSADQWTPFGEYAGTGVEGAFVLQLSDTRVLVGGGLDANDAFQSACYEGVLGDGEIEWTRVDDFPGEPRTGTVGAVADGMGYAGFGRSLQSYEVLDDWYAYDPNTGTWSPRASSTIGSAEHGIAFALGGAIYVSGDPMSSTLQYDPLTDEWCDTYWFRLVNPARWVLPIDVSGRPSAFFGRGFETPSTEVLWLP